MSDLSTVIEDLYASEINFTVSSFWDAGYSVRIGDELNGLTEKSELIDGWANVLEELRYLAVITFPNSDFAKKYK